MEFSYLVSAGQGGPVGVQGLVHPAVDLEFFLDGPEGVFAALLPEGLVLHHAADGLRHGVRVAVGHQQAVPGIVVYDVAVAAHIGSHHRQARGHGLDEEEGQCLLLGGADAQVGALV